MDNTKRKGKPIVSDCNSESKNVSSFIDIYLKGFAMDYPSYIQKTYDFVEKIKALTLPDNCLVITLDAESMYTNIYISPSGCKR